MNSSLKKLIKYLVYGVIISLLICVIPNKQPNKGENLMVVMVAVGSLVLLDNLCPNNKNKEGMENTHAIELPVDMSVYYPKKKSNQKKNKKEEKDIDENTEDMNEEDYTEQEEDYTEQEEDYTEQEEEEEDYAEQEEEEDDDDDDLEEKEDNQEEDYMEEENNEYTDIMEEQIEEKEVDKKLKEELGCDCTDEIKKIRHMFKSELVKMKNNNIKREQRIMKDLEKYKKKYSKEKSKNLDNIVVNKEEEEDLYNNTSLDINGKNDWDEAVALAKETFNIKKKILTKKQKIKVIKKATEILIRKEIMKSMGIINTSFNNLPTPTRKKIIRMTNKALSLEDLIISKLNFSNNVPKIVRKKRRNKIKSNYSNTNYNNTNQENSPYYYDNNSNNNNNNNNWNEMKYSDINKQLYEPLGSNNENFNKTWKNGWTKDGGYVYLNTDKWQVPTKRPPICLTNSKCNVCPSNTSGYPVDLMNWHEANDIKTGSNIQLEYSKKKLNKYLTPGETVYTSN